MLCQPASPALPAACCPAVALHCAALHCPVCPVCPVLPRPVPVLSCPALVSRVSLPCRGCSYSARELRYELRVTPARFSSFHSTAPTPPLPNADAAIHIGNSNLNLVQEGLLFVTVSVSVSTRTHCAVRPRAQDTGRYGTVRFGTVQLQYSTVSRYRPRPPATVDLCIAGPSRLSLPCLSSRSPGWTSEHSASCTVHLAPRSHLASRPRIPFHPACCCCFLLSAFCVLLPAPCFQLPASSFLRPASCFVLSTCRARLLVRS